MMQQNLLGFKEGDISYVTVSLNKINNMTQHQVV